MLAGLIIASAAAEGEPLLRAELPIAGQTLIEHQARLLTAAGAVHLVILVERLPATLLGAIDRLRRSGMSIDVARDAADAADRIHPDDRLIVMADGLVTERGTIDLLLAEPGPAVLTLPSGAGDAAWERIDAGARWAGLLTIDGVLLRQTAAMLGDWDLQSTLLRRAIQAGALFVDAPPSALALLDRRSAADPIDAALATRAAETPIGISDRLLLGPLARLLARPAMKAMIAPDWFHIGAILLCLVGAGLFIVGWTWAGLGALLINGGAEAVGRRIDGLGSRRVGGRPWWRWRLAAAIAALMALAWRLTADGAGWGMLAIALVIVAFVIAILDHIRLIGRPARSPLWLISLDDEIWLLAPFAIFGAWRAGLALMAVHAFASLLMIQRLTARKRADRA